MKTIITFWFCCVILNVGFSQENNILFEYSWKNTKTVINNVEYFPPNNSEVSNVYAHFNASETNRTFYTIVCNTLFANASNPFTSNTITFNNIGITLINCIEPLNNSYEYKYFGFFTYLIPPGETIRTYQYELIPVGDGYQLILTNPQGNKVYYNGEHLAVNEIKKAAQISVSPNPFKDRLILNSLHKELVYTAKIIDFSGKIVLETSISQTEKAEIETIDLAQGNYILVINSSEGQESFKVIKE